MEWPLFCESARMFTSNTLVTGTTRTYSKIYCTEKWVRAFLKMYRALRIVELKRLLQDMSDKNLCLILILLK